MTSLMPEPTTLLEAGVRTTGILAGAVPLPGDTDWRRGISVRFGGCSCPVLRDGCATDPDTPEGAGTRGDFAPVLIRNSALCTPMSGEDLESTARDRALISGEHALGQQLMSDAAGIGNPSLADATVLGTVSASSGQSGAIAALGCLEDAAAETGCGLGVTIHATPRGVTWLASANLIGDDGRTAAGSRVLTSPGYAGGDPEASVTALWATGRVWAAIDGVESFEALDFRRNSSEVWAQRYGIVVFDPCLNLRIDWATPACPAPA